jgi:hypothetical protein
MRDRALKALVREFEKSLIAHGRATQVFCHAHIHGGRLDYGSSEYDEFNSAFNALWEDADKDRRSADQRNSHYLKLTRQGDIQSSVFKTYFDFHLALTAKVARRIFLHLVQIADGADKIEWAASHVRQLIWDSRAHVIAWIREACDGGEVNPDQWTVPAFITMMPAGHVPYDPDRAWKRMDVARTTGLLEGFADEWVTKLEDGIETDAGAVYIEAARLEAAKRRESKVIEARPSAEAVAAPDGKEQEQKRSEPAGKKKTPAEECSPERRSTLIDLVDKNVRGFVSFAEAACIFECDKGTISNWIEKGRKLKQVGRRITAASVRALLVKEGILPPQ